MTDQSSLGRARLSVLAMFFVMGAIFANWAARIPAFQDRFALSDGELGVLLLSVSAGVLTALSIASSLIARFSSRTVTAAGAAAISLILPLLALMPNPILLWIALFVFGGATSIMDVAMNAQGVEVQRRRGAPLMSSFHAAYSLGGVAGAGVGAGMAALQADPRVHFAIVGGAFLLIGLWAGRGLVAVEHETRSEGPVFQIPARVLWPIGAIAFLAAIGEGAMADWSAVYLENVVLTGADVAALGYAAFSLTMTIGRLTGDWLSTRLAPPRLVRAGGLVAGLGLLAAILMPRTPVVMLGFAAAGIGLANVIPLAFSAAGSVPGVPSSRGIAGVATIGYAGFLAGPPVIGLVAEVLSLRGGLGVVALGVGAIALFGQAIQRGQPRSGIVDHWYNEGKWRGEAWR